MRKRLHKPNGKRDGKGGKRTIIESIRGKVTVRETDTGREYPLGENLTRKIDPETDVVKVPKGSQAKIWHYSGKINPIKAQTKIENGFKVDLEDEVSPDEILVVGGDGTPDVFPDPEASSSAELPSVVDLYYAGQPYLEVTPPTGDEDDSVIITG